jgi:hypothetical protein
MSKRSLGPRWQKYATFLLTVLFVGVIYMSMFRRGEKSLSDKEKKRAAGITIESGFLTSIPYYRCSSSSSSSGGGTTEEVRDVVLLHGSRFTKENWKTSGIMEKFCSNNNIRVTAFDLDVQATHEELDKLLLTMKESHMVSTLPVDALVTPSASGSTIVKWVLQGDVDKLTKERVRRWIPVASNSVNQLTTSNLAKLKGWPILAIYGDKDVGGKHSSELLEEKAGATLQVISGGHPCYLDSPDTFVKRVVRYLDETK